MSSLMKLILPRPEARVQSGSQDSAVFNAMAKIFIDSDNNPETFLKENNLYEPLVTGKFGKARDPYLAYIAYTKGFCDDELIGITNDNSMLKHQARYLMKHHQPELWVQVLVHDSVHRRALIDCRDPSPFSDNCNLQNLLLLTSIRTDKEKVIGSINKLQNYNTGEIAEIATDHGLSTVSMQWLSMVSSRVSPPFTMVWTMQTRPTSVSRLAKAQLDGLRIKDAIDSYIKAEDPSNFAEVIEILSHTRKHDDLVRFLQMPHKTFREPKINTVLAYAYAKTDHLHEMEDFLAMTNVADILEVGEKCFEDKLYQAAKLLFTSISNWAHLATALIYLGKNQAAVESARKARNTQYIHSFKASILN
ncbi:hypothetical protein EDB19DRAFT_1960363 [Suillus lakei]|nr:hypothetical protein EDB19DRAFT_1960363 [Suillus lakei]